MQRLQRQTNKDSRWDSAIDRLELKYGLHLDDWKRLGRDQMGQKCGRGWYGLRGACKRGKKGADNSAAIKESKLALADRIRKRKGLADRNAPKVEDDSLQRLEQLIALKKTLPQDIAVEAPPKVSTMGGSIYARFGAVPIGRARKEESKAAKNREAQRLKEGSKVVAGGLTRKELDDFSFESVGRRSVGQLSELPNGQIVTFRGEGRSRRSSGIPDGDYFQVTKTTKSGSTYGIPLDKSGKAISDKSIRLKNMPAKWLEVADVNEDQKKYGTFGSVEELNTKYGRSDSDNSTHFDAAEITRYTRAIASLNDRYGWHLDAQKVLSKLGKKLGKKCGGGWISPEKRCKSHYTNGKLNESGKASGENLADRIRQRKKLSTVSRDGKGKELAYAFLPGNQKQSTMTARRTHAPKSGYETPGRLSKTSNTEERRSMVGLGQYPGTRSKPDTAPIMDLPTRPASTPTSTMGAQYLSHPQTNESMRKHEGVKMIANAIDFNGGFVDMGAKDLGTVKVIKLNPKSKAQRWGSATIETDSGDGVERRNVSLPIVADAVRRTSQDNATKGAFERQNKQGQENMHGASTPTPIEAGKSLKSLFAEADRIGAKYQDKPQTFEERRVSKQGADRVMNESGMSELVAKASGAASISEARRNRERIANAPVRIPNQRSSSEPRKRGRSVD